MATTPLPRITAPAQKRLSRPGPGAGIPTRYRHAAPRHNIHHEIIGVFWWALQGSNL
ncbi:MAG: hypothetical protein AB7O57_05165 [Hyphomicrobiaceae bacterium]